MDDYGRNYPQEWDDRYDGIRDDPTPSTSCSQVQKAPKAPVMAPAPASTEAFNSDRGPNWRQRDLDCEFFGVDKHTSEAILNRLKILTRSIRAPETTAETRNAIEEQIALLKQQAVDEAQARKQDYNRTWLDRAFDADERDEGKNHGRGYD